jgi:hypothetical protein
VATLALRPANRPMKASMLPWEWAARTPKRPPAGRSHQSADPAVPRDGGAVPGGA